MRREFGFTGFGIGNPRSIRAAAAVPDPYGPELIVNGDFSSDAGWNLTGEVPPTISGGKLNCVAMPDGGRADRSIPSLTTTTYHTVFTIDSITDGVAVIELGTVGAGTVRTAPGTYIEDIVVTNATGTLGGISINTEGTVVIDNLSVKLVL